MKTALIASAIALGAFAIAVHDASAWQQYSMPKTVTSTPNITGGSSYIDENYNRLGSSVPNVTGGYDFYDKNYNHVGTSRPNITGGTTYTWDK